MVVNTVTVGALPSAASLNAPRLSAESASFRPSCLEVIDPCNRTGKIVIPMEYIIETKGMTELNRPRESRDLSLCLLFQKGRCNAGARCHQIHADAEFVNKLRAQAAAGTACCAFHGDYQSSSNLTMAPRTVEVYTNGVAACYSLVSFGRTIALDAALQTPAGQAVRINSTKVCRLHSEGRCKFGRDCKNIHLCPNAKAIPFAAASARSNIAAAAASSVPQPLAPLSRPQFSKPAVHIEFSRNDFESSLCGLSSCPDSPAKSSHRSSSAASTVVSPAPTDNGMSLRIAALQEAAAANTAAGSTRTSPNGPQTSRPVPMSTMPQQSVLIFVPSPMARSSATNSPLMFAPPRMDEASFEGGILSWPMRSLGAVASPMGFCSPTFHSTANLIAMDLANTIISPSWYAVQ